MKVWTRRYKDDLVEVHVRTYANERLAIQLMSRINGDGADADLAGMLEPYATLTVNLPDDPCEHDEVYIKDYSENEGMLKWAIDNGIVTSTVRGIAASGYVTITRHRLTRQFQIALMASERRTGERLMHAGRNEA